MKRILFESVLDKCLDLDYISDRSSFLETFDIIPYILNKGYWRVLELINIVEDIG